MTAFDDSRVEDPAALASADALLRRLASAGARLRIEAAAAEQAVANLVELDRPRAVIVVGDEARLIRAVLEPVCPVPLMAWPSQGLPGWVGPLDQVVVLASTGSEHAQTATVHEARRRGARVLIACPENSPAAEQAGTRGTTSINTTTQDPLAAAVVVLSALNVLGLGPEVDAPAVADKLDRVAEDCSPYVDLSLNPAKELALSLADDLALVWGGSVLASRAGRRLAEAIRAASGRTALAADATELLPVIDATRPLDVFADPFDDPVQDRRPCLICLDDGQDQELSRIARRNLVASAERAGVRVCRISHQHGSSIERYCALLQTGLYAAAYLAIGLGRYRDLD